jgi:hypothetical protein
MSDPIALARLNARFWSKVDPSAGPSQCWPFVGCITKSGYGRILAGEVLGGPAVWIAPRVAYALTFGGIPEGAELDHLCHTRDRRCIQGSECPHRRCVNPAHLEPVTHRENALRREIRRDFFRCGHPFAGNRVQNGGGGRCAECHRTKEQRARAEGRRSA